MPQMMPIYWLPMLLLFSTLFMFLSIIMYFISPITSQFPKLTLLSRLNTALWKW